MCIHQKRISAVHEYHINIKSKIAPLRLTIPCILSFIKKSCAICSSYAKVIFQTLLPGHLVHETNLAQTLRLRPYQNIMYSSPIQQTRRGFLLLAEKTMRLGSKTFLCQVCISYYFVLYIIQISSFTFRLSGRFLFHRQIKCYFVLYC